MVFMWYFEIKRICITTSIYNNSHATSWKTKLIFFHHLNWYWWCHRLGQEDDNNGQSNVNINIFSVQTVFPIYSVLLSLYKDFINCNFLQLNLLNAILFLLMKLISQTASLNASIIKSKLNWNANVETSQKLGGKIITDSQIVW